MKDQWMKGKERMEGDVDIEVSERQPAQCYKCAGGQHSRCHGQWDDVFGDFGPVTDPPRKMACNCQHRNKQLRENKGL